MLIEFHWAFTPWYFGFDQSLDEVWPGRTDVRIGQRTVQTLGPEDTAILLSVYACRRRWERLGALVDLTEAIRSRPPDWELMVQRAGEFKVSRIVNVSLALAHEHLALELPPLIMGQIQGDPGGGRLQSNADSALRARLVAEAGPFAKPSFMILRARERLRDRIRYTLPLAFRVMRPPDPDPTWDDYVLRPVRLLGKFGIAPLGALIRNIVRRPRA